MTGTHITFVCVRACNKHTRYGYDVPGMVLLKAYLYTYNILRGGVNFKVLPLSSYALSPTMLPLLETFLELLLWWDLFIPLRQTLFFKTARGNSETNQGIRVDVQSH
jgi:hypothetical protein